MRPGAHFFQRTLRTLWFSGGTGRAAKKDQTQAEIVPVLSGDDVHQVKFDFNRVFIFGQTEPV